VGDRWHFHRKIIRDCALIPDWTWNEHSLSRLKIAATGVDTDAANTVAQSTPTVVENHNNYSKGCILMDSQNNKFPIYTIGHGTRSVTELIKLLKQYEINYLVDIRSKPYSKYNPELNSNALKLALEKELIKYVFMGDLLGGLPNDECCYTSGKVDYEKLSKSELFLRGIDRIKNAYNQNLKISMMCSESKPHDCHRTKLVGTVLTNQNIKVSHINEKGNLISQEDAILLATGGQNEYDIFGNLDIKSKGKYK
jgi:hypothetical protein